MEVGPQQQHGQRSDEHATATGRGAGRQQRSEKRWRWRLDGWSMAAVMAAEGRGDHGGNNNGEDAGGGRRQAEEPRPPPPPWVAAVLPGLASAPREAALEDRGFVLDGLAEFWAAAAAAAKVARFCNCRALIPGERSQRGWCQTRAARPWRGRTGTQKAARRPQPASGSRADCCVCVPL